MQHFLSVTAEPEGMQIQVRKERAQEQILKGLKWEKMCGQWQGIFSVAHSIPKISFYLRFALNFWPLYHSWLSFLGMSTSLRNCITFVCVGVPARYHSGMWRSESSFQELVLRSSGLATGASPTLPSPLPSLLVLFEQNCF